MKIGLWITMLAVTLLIVGSMSGCILATPEPAATEAEATAAPTQPTPPPATAAGQSPTAAATSAAPRNAGPRSYSSPPPMTINVASGYAASIRTTMGVIKVELFPGQAPVTVNNFVFLAQEGFYDGLTFHRVIENFMIQGGDPIGNGTGGPGYKFQDEIDLALSFDEPGKLAMANSGAGTGTNGSQFFITTVATPHLDGSHTIFGQVTDGQQVIDSISRVSGDAQNRPLRPVIIEAIEIQVTPRS